MLPEETPNKVLTPEQFIQIVAVLDLPNSTFTLDKDIAPDDCNVIFYQLRSVNELALKSY